MESGFDVVTGAFSYTGRFIARKLLDDGRRVRFAKKSGEVLDV